MLPPHFLLFSFVDSWKALICIVELLLETLAPGDSHVFNINTGKGPSLASVLVCANKCPELARDD